MHVLFLISTQAKISEIKKIPLIINDLISKNCTIYLFNLTRGNQEAKFFLKQSQYNNYQVIGKSENKKSLKECFALINEFPIEKIVVLGLIHFDSFSIHLDELIGTNIDLYMVVPTFQTRNDASFFINQGAYVYNCIDDLSN